MQMFTMASVTPSSSFKEFCPLYYLLNAIPTKIQKGFRSILVYLTALDTNGEYIAVGSSIGMLYLYCRHLNRMKKYNFEGKNESITVVKLLSCFDDLVAVGTASGKIAIFQLVPSLPGRNKQLRRFNVSGFHKSSITALAWSPNGMKLFSGDDRGKIVYSALDLDKGLCTSSLVLEEPCSIVQLDYSQKVLLVSTLQRSLLFYTEEKSVKQVGSQPRKNTGKFGACFIPGLCKRSDLTLFAGRPGIRLWKSDVHGTVQATFILKDVFAAGMKPFELYPRMEPLNKNSYSFPERQLGLISCFFQEGWVLSWNEYSIYLLDTVNQTMIGSLEGSGDIVSVSCTENEIFLLKGDRDIIRISSRPEGLMSTDISSKLMSPLSDLSPKLQSPHSVIESMPSNPSPGTNQILSGSTSPQTPGDKNGTIGKSDLDVALVTEKIRSQSFDGLRDLSIDPRRRGYSVASESRSRSSSVNSVDSSSIFLTGGDQTSSEIHREGQLPSQRFSLISSEDFNQELIVKPIKVKKKKKRRPENGIRRNPSSLESTPCYEYQGFSDSSPLLNADSFSINSSLMGSITDRLSMSSMDQESVFSTESQNVLREENGSETFSVLQSPESVAALTPEDNGATELLELSNNESALGTLPTMDFSTSDSPSLLTGDQLGCDDAEYNWNSLQSEQTKAILELPSQKEAHVSLPHNMENTSDKLESLEETSSEKGMSANVQATFNAEDGSFGWVVGIENNPEQKQQEPLRDIIAPSNNSFPHILSEKEMCPQECVLPQQDLTETFQAASNTHSAHKWISDTHDVRTEKSVSSDEEDIYGHGLPYSSSETSVTEMRACLPPQDKILNRTNMEEGVLLKSDQFAESWMGYAGPGYGILSLVVSDKYIWCLDYKGGLYCSALPSAGLRWQRFEDNVQQVAVSPSGALLWKVEQKTNKAFACGKVTIKGKRHWYEALPQTAFVSLSDDTAWIIRTNGDLYLQTGLSVDRPCARAVKVDCPYPLSQVTARNNVVWALTEQRALLFREGVSSFCPEGEQWKCDIISEMQALEPVCVTLGDQQTIWVLDIHGNLWFRTGVASKKPQGDDNHWWQVSITDYVVFDQSSLFQTIIQATQTVATAAQAPVEKVADKLRMAFWSQPLQCQPSLLAVNSGGVWISSGKNEFHVAKGSLVGTYWNNVVPRGTASVTKWAFVLASASPTKEGSFLWLCQSNKDLFCVSDQNPQFHPSTVQLPPDGEIVYYSACQDAIWCLDSLGQVFIRTLSPNCPSGMHWTKLDLSQLGAVKLRSLACGNQHIWACDGSGGIYFRVGTQPLNPSLMLPAWIMIEPPIQPVGINLISVYSSPNDQSLWAIDSKWNIHVRIGITEEMPVGTDWEQIPGLQACELAISTRTVWARCPNGDIARRYGITDKNPAGDYWKKIPGNVSCLTATFQDELWAVGSSGNLLHRLTKTFHHSHTLQKHGNASISFLSDDFEDEWEVI
ncbi:tectonin beta-propeller repeat-containing protein 2 [Sceloporus undulatus]|uniref:tectonin beta-propeller repeat-containing protein 2 n=1 Tax=Sceloporus undulatus TaxID=8520 RepID=UPI001C4AE07B|nr:tectonin beta-propeller repeat-containing protein 2 [Sceloporus undulatus]XP_042302050.1 tectonin beta-propeller repeat-containing protein 2 [Sceloporus undulatus]